MLGLLLRAEPGHRGCFPTEGHTRPYSHPCGADRRSAIQTQEKLRRGEGAPAGPPREQPPSSGRAEGTAGRSAVPPAAGNRRERGLSAEPRARPGRPRCERRTAGRRQNRRQNQARGHGAPRHRTAPPGTKRSSGLRAARWRKAASGRAPRGERSERPPGAHKADARPTRPQGPAAARGLLPASGAGRGRPAASAARPGTLHAWSRRLPAAPDPAWRIAAAQPPAAARPARDPAWRRTPPRRARSPGTWMAPAPLPRPRRAHPLPLGGTPEPVWPIPPPGRGGVLLIQSPGPPYTQWQRLPHSSPQRSWTEPRGGGGTALSRPPTEAAWPWAIPLRAPPSSVPPPG